MFRLATAVLALAFAGNAVATKGGVYRWIDDRGNIHYDDLNLLGERITRSTLNEREVAPEPIIKVPEEFAEEVRLRCTDFSERASSYRKAGEVYGRDPFGNSYRLSPVQVALARNDADKLKTRFCRADAPRLILVEERAARRAAEQAKAKAAKNAKLASRARY